MLLTAEQKCLLWLSAAEITPDRVSTLIEQYGSAEAIWDAFGKTNGPQFQETARKTLDALHSRDAIDALHGKLERKNVQLLFQTDDAYPAQLNAIHDPPYLLYYAGRIECLRFPMIALVGTRKASGYGMEMAQMLAKGLSEAGICVVSGLARGIDGAAHEATVNAGGRTVGILGSGINVPYPPEHTSLLRKMAGGIGLVLSEYPLDAQPRPYHFPHRNRIISGLSMGVVFVEGRIKSGGMHTVHAALMQGREVFAVPGKVGAYGSEGPHAILREGARIVTSAQELLDDLGLAEPKEKPQKAMPSSDLTILQQGVIACLRREPLGVHELASALNLSENDVITELGMLEILGFVQREAGNRFHLPVAARK